MDGEKSADLLCWYAVHTKPKQEDRIDQKLRLMQVETFLPKVQERRYHYFTEKASYVIKPLFPSYLFARFRVNELLHKISYTRGVHSVLSCGGRPYPLDDEIIEMMKSRLGADGLVRLGEKLKRGDKVVINKGLLRHVEGVFEEELKDHERVSILLTTVSYQNRVVIERELLRKVS
jgi:transcription elongation factor/antiterminator RfaH